MPFEALLRRFQGGLVMRLVRFDVWGEIKRRAALRRHHQRQQQSTHAPVAVAEGVNGLEVCVGQGHADYERLAHALHALAAHVPHRIFKPGGNVYRRGRVVGRVCYVTTAPDPDNARSQLARHILISAIAPHPRTVKLLDLRNGEDRVLFCTRARDYIIKGERVIAHLDGSFAGFLGTCFLDRQKLVERAVRTFYRRAADSFPAGQDAADEPRVLERRRPRSRSLPAKRPRH